jgi:hypothetical protein
MKRFSFQLIVDPANKFLICEAFGELLEIVEFEHMLKTIIKMAGKNQVNNIVLDTTECKILCSNVNIAKLLIKFEENGLFGDLKIARVVKFDPNVKDMIEGLAAKLCLSIKNVETRSQAMLWLLFDK